MGELDTIRLEKAVRLIKKYGYALRGIKGSHHIIISQIIDILGLSKEEFLKEIKKL